MDNITLVIGTYNPNKEWFDNALQSANGLFDETIIVDDGSTNPLESTVRHETNKGFYEARNTGISLAKDGWIASIDDDDEFIRENVELLKHFIQQTDADVVHFPIELFGEQHGIWGDNYSYDDFLNANQIPSGSWFRKSVWEKLGGFTYSKAEDWDFWVRAIKKQLKFTYFPLPIYRHRMRKDSLSGSWVGDTFISIRNDIRTNYENYK